MIVDNVTAMRTIILTAIETETGRLGMLDPKVPQGRNLNEHDIVFAKLHQIRKMRLTD